MKPNMKVEIDKIMSKFNFEKVRIVMRLVGWEYQHNRERRIPDIEELKSAAMLNLETVANGALSSQTGGFKAYIQNEEGSDILTLEFILESQDAFVRTEPDTAVQN